MSFVGRRQNVRRPGSSSQARFRAARWKVLRENWRDWLLTAAFGAGSVAAALLLDSRPAALVFAGVAGATVTLGVVGWVVGDVYSLPWMWGAVGERQTAEALSGLDGSWRCEHDIPRARGNWDHVLVGPPGVFLLDSKRLKRRAVVTGDGLSSGRFSYGGGGFRRAARDLHDSLEARVGRRTWVQAVVVVWGEFPQRRVERDKVMYVHGSELLPWLRSRPGRLSTDDCEELFEAVRQIGAA
jgi:Nuclease-related domain